MTSSASTERARAACSWDWVVNIEHIRSESSNSNSTSPSCSRAAHHYQLIYQPLGATAGTWITKPYSKESSVAELLSTIEPEILCPKKMITYIISTITMMILWKKPINNTHPSILHKNRADLGTPTQWIDYHTVNKVLVGWQQCVSLQ